MSFARSARRHQARHQSLPVDPGTHPSRLRARDPRLKRLVEHYRRDPDGVRQLLEMARTRRDVRARFTRLVLWMAEWWVLFGRLGRWLIARLFRKIVPGPVQFVTERST